MAYYTILGFQKIKSKSKQENYSLLTNFGNTIPALRAYNSMSSLNAENIRNSLNGEIIKQDIYSTIADLQQN